MIYSAEKRAFRDKARVHRRRGARWLRDCRLPQVIQIATWGSVPTSRLADTNFYACSSRGRIRLQPDVIVNRIAKTLLAAQVLLRRLN